MKIYCGFAISNEVDVNHGCDDEKVGESLGVLQVSNEEDSCTLTGVSILIERFDEEHKENFDFDE